MERIGDRLKRLREAAGLSQRELAKRSGVARPHINQIEANKTKSITLRTAEALARGMGISPASFFNGSYRKFTGEIVERLIEHIKNFQ